MGSGFEASLPPIRLSEDRAREAAALLGAAFQNDPLFVYACPDPDERARWLPWLLIWSVWWGFLRGEVLGTAGHLDGVAIMVPSSGDDGEHDEVARAARHARAEWKLSAAELAAWERYDAAEEAAFQPPDAELHRVAPLPHWYLAVLGVAPGRQGQGIGSGLLRAVNARADADGLPCILLTYQPDNLVLYQRHGYETICEGTEAQSGLRWWGMQRPPSTA